MMRTIWALCFSAGLAMAGCSSDPCGNVGEACCEANACEDGLSCGNGLCLVSAGGCSAGSRGCPCLADDTCNLGSLICSADSRCVNCGQVGQPCCAGDACLASNLSCQSGTCAVPVTDAGPQDAAPVDAAPVDSGEGDSGISDTGTSTTPDSGTDAG